VTCKQCGKPDWAGCGAHVEQVLGDVPAAQRCQCRTNPPQRAPKPKAGKGFWRRRG